MRQGAGGFGVIRGTLRFLFRRIVGIYFREIAVAGDAPTAETAGRLFAANHVNGLVDPILVLTQAACPISPVAKSTLWKIPGLVWLLDAADAVPIVRRRDDPNKNTKDNDEIFDRVAGHLADGGNILIFPEGTSHNEPHLLELRSGAGRMLARAFERSKDVTFQAVALEFDRRDVFRSRVVVLFGPPRRVADLHGTSDLSAQIKETLRADLSELLIQGATWEERVLVVRVAEMFANDAAAASMSEVSRAGRKIAQVRRLLATASPEVVSHLEERVRSYFAMLEDADERDEEVARIVRGNASTRAWTPNLAAAVRFLTLPLAAFALAAYWLPYQVPRLVTRRLSSDPDVASTYKLGVGLLVFPLWAVAGVVASFAALSPSWAALAAAGLVAGPFAALPWLDRWDRAGAHVTLVGSIEDRRERLSHLAEARRSLMGELENVRAAAEAGLP